MSEEQIQSFYNDKDKQRHQMVFAHDPQDFLQQMQNAYTVLFQPDKKPVAIEGNSPGEQQQAELENMFGGMFKDLFEQVPELKKMKEINDAWERIETACTEWSKAENKNQFFKDSYDKVTEKKTTANEKVISLMKDYTKWYKAFNHPNRHYKKLARQLVKECAEKKDMPQKDLVSLLFKFERELASKIEKKGKTINTNKGSMHRRLLYSLNVAKQGLSDEDISDALEPFLPELPRDMSSTFSSTS